MVRIKDCQRAWHAADHGTAVGGMCDVRQDLWGQLWDSHLQAKTAVPTMHPTRQRVPGRITAGSCLQDPVPGSVLDLQMRCATQFGFCSMQDVLLQMLMIKQRSFSLTDHC